MYRNPEVFYKHATPAGVEDLFAYFLEKYKYGNAIKEKPRKVRGFLSNNYIFYF
jgi:hypothetical protein